MDSTSTTAPIPLVDLQTQSRAIKADVLRRIADVIDGARYILGQEVQEFEEQFAAYCGTDHCVGLANGTEALHLALRALEIGPGDEVITAGNSFAATAFAIAYAGAEAVFVDVDPADFNIDVTLIEQAITERTKAIIPVHLYGQPARMNEIREIADRHDLRIIEDAAQAHSGDQLDGQRCGSFGDIGCFSFYPGKNLGAFGDGGAAVTNDPELAEKLRLLRNYGQKQKNRHDLLGFNCRLDTVQACVLLSKMQKIEEWTEQRRTVANWYREELADVNLILPHEVGEHLPKAASKTLVESLTRASDRVLFSAAVVGQGGEFHVNEQPLSFWQELFAEHGYHAYDCLRPHLKADRSVEPWYRYNAILYVNDVGRKGLPRDVLEHAVAQGTPVANGGDALWRLRRGIVSNLPQGTVTRIAQVRAAIIAARAGGTATTA